MSFEFIPYQLNADISDFKDNVEYISSDNGVELYRGREDFMKLLLGFQVTATNLYFFEGSLITAYIHLGENPENIEQVSKIFEHLITRSGKTLKLRYGNGYKWENKTSAFALIHDMRKETLYLYHSLKRFDVLY